MTRAPRGSIALVPSQRSSTDPSSQGSGFSCAFAVRVLPELGNCASVGDSPGRGHRGEHPHHRNAHQGGCQPAEHSVAQTDRIESHQSF